MKLVQRVSMYTHLVSHIIMSYISMVHLLSLMNQYWYTIINKKKYWYFLNFGLMPFSVPESHLGYHITFSHHVLSFDIPPFPYWNPEDSLWNVFSHLYQEMVTARNVLSGIVYIIINVIHKDIYIYESHHVEFNRTSFL